MNLERIIGRYNFTWIGFRRYVDDGTNEQTHLSLVFRVLVCLAWGGGGGVTAEEKLSLRRR